MFEDLKGKTQGIIDEDYRRDYNESVEATEDNEGEDNSDYQICINVRNGDEYYVDDCKENWDIFNNLNNETSCFIYFKDSENGMLGIRVSEIIAFYPERSVSINYDIEDLGLSVRTYNCLKRAGLNTLDDILNYSDSNGLYKIRNFGLNSFYDLKRAVKNIGCEKDLVYRKS